MKTKDLYLLICWDSYENNPYQVKKHSQVDHCLSNI